VVGRLETVLPLSLAWRTRRATWNRYERAGVVGGMRVKTVSGLVLCAAMLLVFTGCTDGRAAPPPSPSPSPFVGHQAAGGCAGTFVSDAVPPDWARGGLNFQPGRSWQGPPWAAGKPAGAVAYLFAGQLVAQGRRPDGTANKVLWVVRGSPASIDVEGRPLGRSGPVVTIAGPMANANQLPSQVDLPTPGCWSFRIASGSAGAQTSIINLDVLPPGTLPSSSSPSP
jgi:hypothetical protein